MAHVEKFKRSSCSAMLHHYRRDLPGVRSRSNIDSSRTHLNFVLGRGGGMEEINQRAEEVSASSGRAIRKDAVLMADWVITAPADLRSEDLRPFFEFCHEFVCDRYGVDNVLGAYVHMDETTPHAHIPFTPVLRREDGRLSFAAHKMIDRTDLRTFHNDLSDHVESRLGYRPMIQLNQDMKLERALSNVKGLEDFKLAAERLERLRGREQELTRANQDLERSLRDAKERYKGITETREVARDEVERLQEKASRSDSRVEWLSRRVAKVKERLSALRPNVEYLREKAYRLEARLSDFLSRIEQHRSLGDMRQYDPYYDYSPESERSSGHEYER